MRSLDLAATVAGVGCIAALVLGCQLRESRPADTKHTIGATARIVLKSNGATLPARIDTGAHTCSIDAREVEVADSADDPRDDIGKPIRFRGRDGDWITTAVAGAATVETADGKATTRYEVDLTLQWGEVEKEVRVTLNDRSGLTYPMLLGRNFLLDDIVVDVSLDRDDGRPDE